MKAVRNIGAFMILSGALLFVLSMFALAGWFESPSPDPKMVEGFLQITAPLSAFGALIVAIANWASRRMRAS